MWCAKDSGSARILDCLRVECNGHLRKNDTILGLATTCRDFILFEWDLKPYDRKISLYKLILFVLRVSHYFGRFLTNWTLLAPFLGRYYGSVSYLREILSDNDT